VSTENNSISPKRIRSLSGELERKIASALTEIDGINRQTQLLAVNAQIEATRAGFAGRAFNVVGQEMVLLANNTKKAVSSITSNTGPIMEELAHISMALDTVVRGTRLCDLAQMNINFIDRNLYERSCDCRWWATDMAVVDALSAPTPEKLSYVVERLGVILKAYTVYFDIVIADLKGLILANGRPHDYASAGSNHKDSTWFSEAMATPDGDHYGFQGVHASPLAGGERVLIYSCKVCVGGRASAKPVGVLGVVFKWDALAQVIVKDTPIEPEYKSNTQVHVVDRSGKTLASTTEGLIGQSFSERGRDVLKDKKQSEVQTLGGHRCLVAQAPSVGYETYKTGWTSLIIQSQD